jgi:hypothetical protein
MTKFVSYLHVPTQQQGKSGLGLDAQRSAVHGFAGSVLAEVVEVESGIHRGLNRPCPAFSLYRGAERLHFRREPIAIDLHLVGAATLSN